MSEKTIDDTTTRRTVMAAAVSALGLSALTGQVSAQADGTVGIQTSPYEIAYVETLVLSGLTSDPSTTVNAQIWYRSDL